MFAAWGAGVARFRWPVFAVALAAVVAAGVWGLGVFGQLTEGGYNDPGSESTRAAEVVQEALGAQGGDVVVIYTPARGSIDDPALARRVEDRLAALPRDAVTGTTSYWQAKAPQYVSADRRSAVAVLTLAGADDAEKLDSYREISDRLDVEGATTRLAGGAALADATTTRSTRDLAIAEAVSLPIVLILLLFMFGSLVAAALPVIVGGAAVLGSLGVLHAVASGHDVNSFAVNVASLLGLGMAIDYGLFMVGRFREEQSYGRSPADAVTRTVATAGRTVAFSATLLMIALGGLLLFPQGFLKSLAYGGLASVALAAVLSLTLLPALLAILGPRVDKLPVRLPRRATGRPAGTGWARLADVVLRRPVLVALPIIAGLLVLAAPVAGVQFGEADERVLPADEPARQAIETLRADFPALSSSGIQVVLRGRPAAAETFAETLRGVPGVAEVTPAGAAGDVTVFTATPRATDPFGTRARDTVRDIRALPPPAGAEVLVGGATARNVDSLDATADRLPLMVALLAGATLVLMFLAFGSVLLPVKAVLMSALSLAATFGVLVWIFQDGHGAGLLGITPAPPEVGIVVLMAAVVFGLSTDYEVFLLSRMVEARTRGATTAEAVTTGLARTGRVISAAALLLIVVTGAFALSSVTTMRFVGVGMIIALLLDATVVRMLLVPAVLGLMGDAAWWAPGPLRRLQEKAGLAEYEDEELFPTVSVGRHAAPGEAVARSTGTSRPRHASPEPPVAPVSPAPSAPRSPAVREGAVAAVSSGSVPSPAAGIAPAASGVPAPGTDPVGAPAPVTASTAAGETTVAVPTLDITAPKGSGAAGPVSADSASAGEATAGSASAGSVSTGPVSADPDSAGPGSADSIPAGLVPAGSGPAGPGPTGSVPAGSVPAGSVPAGSVPAGPVTAGSRPAGAVGAGENAAGPAGGDEQPASPPSDPGGSGRAAAGASDGPATVRIPTGEQVAPPPPAAAARPGGTPPGSPQAVAPATDSQPPHVPAVPGRTPHAPATTDGPFPSGATADEAPDAPATPGRAPHAPATTGEPPRAPTTTGGPSHAPATTSEPPHATATTSEPPHAPTTAGEPPHAPATTNQTSHAAATTDKAPHATATDDKTPGAAVTTGQEPHAPARTGRAPGGLERSDHAKRPAAADDGPAPALPDAAAITSPTGTSPTGERPSAAAGGERPPQSDAQDAIGRSDAAAGTPDGARRAVGLAERTPGPAPDDTAVLDVEPTVDLSTRAEQERRLEQERRAG